MKTDTGVWPQDVVDALFALADTHFPMLKGKDEIHVVFVLTGDGWVTQGLIGMDKSAADKLCATKRSEGLIARVIRYARNREGSEMVEATAHIFTKEYISTGPPEVIVTTRVEGSGVGTELERHPFPGDNSSVEVTDIVRSIGWEPDGIVFVVDKGYLAMNVRRNGEA